jgi:hypothetical protein
MLIPLSILLVSRKILHSPDDTTHASTDSIIVWYISLELDGESPETYLVQSQPKDLDSWVILAHARSLGDDSLSKVPRR